MSADELLHEGLKLPEEERAALAEGLLASLGPTDDAGWEAAWVEESVRRANRLRAGETTADDWRVALSRVRDRLAPKESA